MSNETPTATTRVVIYCRQSQDRTGLSEAVESQRAACEAKAQQLGWTVVAVLTDNDFSAYSGKPRPGYIELLRMLRAGEADAVLAKHEDRLHRSPIELEEYIDVCQPRGVDTDFVQSGKLDLKTASGRMVARIRGAVAREEVERKSEREQDKRLRIAKRGDRHKCARVYGWEDDGIKVRESEAIYVREMVTRLIDGESPTAIAASLNARNIPTITGSKWQGINVRKAATRASNAALREHKGVIYPGNWEPIIDRETWDRVMLAVENRQNMPYKRGTGRKYLLTGLAVCGNCGNKLSATVGSGKAKAAYRCHAYKSSGYGPQGCGKVSRNIAPLELLVTEAVLYRLDSPELLQSLHERQDDREVVSGLLKQRQGVQERLDELVQDYYTDKLITKAQFVKAKSALEAELEDVSRKLGTLNTKRSLGGFDLSGKLRETWESADINWKLAVLELLIDKVVVHAYGPHAKVVWFNGHRFDPELVEIHWLA